MSTEGEGRTARIKPFSNGGALVKNRAPAPIQITAEQLIKEARESSALSDDYFKKKHNGSAIETELKDPEEIQRFRLERRTYFESKIRSKKDNMNTYIKYAKWEESQMEFARARNAFERAISVNFKETKVWLEYANMEMRNEFVNHARNILDRAVNLLPRQAPLWYRYVFLEEMVKKIDNCRQVYERWMKFEPEEQAWISYIKFEERNGDIIRARDVYERYCGANPVAKSYIKYAKWEEKHAQLALARTVFERAVGAATIPESDKRYSGEPIALPAELPESILSNDEDIYLAFAAFEERCKEYDRARAIYQFALSKLPPHRAHKVRAESITFEKRHASSSSISEFGVSNVELAIISKRREEYSQRLEKNPYDYDTWFDWIRLEESEAMRESLTKSNANSSKKQRKERSLVADNRVREVYKKAIACVPENKMDKNAWRRYIYIPINYAIFEELETRDVEKARAVYKAALTLIPHERFTFAKVWILAAELEVRNHDLVAARKILGRSIGLCGKDKLFRNYIQLELQLGSVSRCRILYEKYLQFSPANSNAWIKYAELEAALGEVERARDVYEIAVSQSLLDLPELVWKKYIDFEAGLETTDGRRRAVQIFKRLVDKTNHIKIWISYAQFCFSCDESEDANEFGEKVGRRIFEKANDMVKKKYADIKAQVDDYLSSKKETGADEAEMDEEEERLDQLFQSAKEERVLLLESWREEEEKLFNSLESSTSQPDRTALERVESIQPKIVKKRVPISGEDEQQGWEEYDDYVFPEDSKALPSLRLLELATKWKQGGDNTTSVKNIFVSTTQNSTSRNGEDDDKDDDYVSSNNKRSREEVDEDENEIDIE